MDDRRHSETPGGPHRTPRPSTALEAGNADVWLIDHLLDLASDERTRFVARLRETDRALADRAERHAHVMGVFESVDAGADGAQGPGSPGQASPTVRFARMVEARAEGVVAEFVAASPLEPGDTLGPYRVVRELGRGGTGVVYLAERDDLGLQVALKILLEPFAVARASASGGDGVQVSALSANAEQFYAEPRALARLDHPGVPRVHDAGWTDDGQPFVVMELAHGYPVTEYARRRSLGVAGCVDLFLQLCAAVQHTHGRGLAHGDIKPENVLVREGDPGDGRSGDGRLGGGGARPVVKLVDFGTAWPLRDDGSESDVEAGAAMLTPAYAAPERTHGAPPSVGSDVYALGLLLGELLSGWRQSERESHSGASLSPLLAVLSRATRPDPSDRYRSAGELAAAVRGAACDVAWAALPAVRLEGQASSPGETGMRLQIYPRLSLALSLVALVAAAFAVVLRSR